jgi:hypothetical protein
MQPEFATMARSNAAGVMRAAEKSRAADRRLVDARRALAHAEKASARAARAYLQLISESMRGQMASGLEAPQQTA